MVVFAGVDPALHSRRSQVSASVVTRVHDASKLQIPHPICCTAVAQALPPNSVTHRRPSAQLDTRRGYTAKPCLSVSSRSVVLASVPSCMWDSPRIPYMSPLSPSLPCLYRIALFPSHVVHVHRITSTVAFLVIHPHTDLRDTTLPRRHEACLHLPLGLFRAAENTCM